ncbi:MAG TPA: 4-hydroxy-tetrahydrodipicolinate synthase [Puia sp.]|nr:4-hydroxy-tetrahydrodipicolinate synthase [Puia sp.]
MNLIPILSGTGVALVTPFNSRMEIDEPALIRLIDFVIEGGVEYVVTLGTTGETPVLSKEEKIRIADLTINAVNGRVPVVIGSGGSDTRAVVKEIEALPTDGAVAILSASPYYSKPSQEGIYQHYKAIADASPKPLLLYNVPARTARNVDAQTILRLTQHPNIAGIKEAGGDMAQCALVLRDRPEDFLVVSGDDALAFPQIATGMHGVISVAANSFPDAFSSMVRAALAGNLGKAKELNDSLLEAYYLLFVENNPAGVKAALTALGVIENNLRLPLVPLSNAYNEQLKSYIKRAGHPAFSSLQKA